MINSNKVSTEYRRIIRSLGVDISEHKSMVSKDTYEFAKRIFHQGNEISHYRIVAMYESRHKFYLMASIIYPFIGRGYYKSRPTDTGLLLKGHLVRLLMTSKNPRSKALLRTQNWSNLAEIQRRVRKILLLLTFLDFGSKS